MKLVNLLRVSAVISFLSPHPVWAFGSYTTPYQITLTGNGGLMTFDYAITGDANDGGSPGRISCGAYYCFVGFFGRTGLGQSPSHPKLCDSGGTCHITDNNANVNMAVKVTDGITWDEAYLTYIKKHGRAGQGRLYSVYFHPKNKDYPGIAWGTLCVGFAVLPNRIQTVSQQAPGSACGVVTPPSTSCTFMLPDLIDFGVVNTGDTPQPVTVNGSYSCSAVSSVSAAIATSPSLGGSPLRIYMNGVLLSNTGTRVDRDQSGSLSLRAEFASPLVTPGNHQTSVPVLMAFY
ncbi:Uncharacterised protein [Serratia fonticola]|nr:Uncharacterised protein [Serratia fonticola]CAI1180544.1 Uncharacterised protein [Serratia fonticola]